MLEVRSIIKPVEALVFPTSLQFTLGNGETFFFQVGKSGESVTCSFFVFFFLILAGEKSTASFQVFASDEMRLDFFAKVLHDAYALLLPNVAHGRAELLIILSTCHD